MMFKRSLSTEEPVDIKGRPANLLTSGRWRAVRFLIAAEVLERVAFLAVASNLVAYLTTQLHLGIGTSAIHVLNWLGCCCFLALAGGFIADSYWGRFWTMANFSCLFLLGMFVLTLAETIKALRPPTCAMKLGEKCAKATSKEVGFFWLALVLVAISIGGTAPTRAPLAMDQFFSLDDAAMEEESSMGRSFPRRWFMWEGLSALLAQSVVVYVQENVNWGVGFGIPTVGYAVAVVLMFCGIPYYRHVGPSGSPFAVAARVMVAAVQNHNSSIPVHNDPNNLLDSVVMEKMGEISQHPHTLTYLDRAPIAKSSTETRETTPSFPDDDVAHRTKSSREPCPTSQVADVKQVARLLPVWLAIVPAAAVQAQSVTFFTLQGHTLNSHIGHDFHIPPASLQCAATSAFLLCVFAHGKIKMCAGFSPLQRVRVAMFFAILVMVVAATIEAKRLKEVHKHGMLDKPHLVVPMSILWLLPQYVLIGIMDGFLTLGQLEFYYEEAPERMRSLGITLYLANMGVGDFWTSITVKLVMASFAGKNGPGTPAPWIVDGNINRSRLDHFFGFLALQMAFVACLFLVISQRFIHRKTLRAMFNN